VLVNLPNVVVVIGVAVLVDVVSDYLAAALIQLCLAGTGVQDTPVNVVEDDIANVSASEGPLIDSDRLAVSVLSTDIMEVDGVVFLGVKFRDRVVRDAGIPLSIV